MCWAFFAKKKKKFNLFFISSITACYPMFMFFCRVFLSYYHVNIFFITWYKASILKIFSFVYDSFSSPSCWLLPSFAAWHKNKIVNLLGSHGGGAKYDEKWVFLAYNFIGERFCRYIIHCLRLFFCMLEGKLQLIGIYEISETFFFVRFNMKYRNLLIYKKWKNFILGR